MNRFLGLAFSAVLAVVVGLALSCSTGGGGTTNNYYNDDDDNQDSNCSCYWNCYQDTLDYCSNAVENEDQDAYDDCNNNAYANDCWSNCDDCLSQLVLSGSDDYQECVENECGWDYSCMDNCFQQAQACNDDCPPEDSNNWDREHCYYETCATPAISCLEGCM